MGDMQVDPFNVVEIVNYDVSAYDLPLPLSPIPTLQEQVFSPDIYHRFIPTQIVCVRIMKGIVAAKRASTY